MILGEGEETMGTGTDLRDADGVGPALQRRVP